MPPDNRLTGRAAATPIAVGSVSTGLPAPWRGTFGGSDAAPGWSTLAASGRGERRVGRRGRRGL